MDGARLLDALLADELIVVTEQQKDANTDTDISGKYKFQYKQPKQHDVKELPANSRTAQEVHANTKGKT